MNITEVMEIETPAPFETALSLSRPCMFCETREGRGRVGWWVATQGKADCYTQRYGTHGGEIKYNTKREHHRIQVLISRENEKGTLRFCVVFLDKNVAIFAIFAHYFLPLKWPSTIGLGASRTIHHWGWVE